MVRRVFPAICFLLSIGAVSIVYASSIIIFERDVTLKPASIDSQMTITSPSDFIILGFSGNGSSENPYRISDLNIVSTDGRPCINITGTFSEHYVIEDCFFSNSSFDTDDNAAIVLSAGNGTLMNCEIRDSYNGALLRGNDKKLSDVSFRGIDNYPISCYGCNNVALVAVDIHDSPAEGNALYISDSMNMTIRNSILTVNKTNSLIRPDNSLLIESSSLITIEDTYFEDLRTQWTPEIYWRAMNCTDMLLSNCSVNDLMFLLEDSHDFSITNSIIENGMFYSLNSSSVTVSDSSFSSSTIMIHKGNGSVSVSDNEITNCFTRIEGHNNTVIQNNDISAINGEYGILLEVYTSNSLVHNNFISGFDRGVLVRGESNTIRNNTLTGNEIGVYLSESTRGNHIYYNRFYLNKINAMDNGTENIWDDSVSLGNYWDDLVNSTYTIPGSAGAIDRWPVKYIVETTSVDDQFVLISVIIGAVVIIMVGVFVFKKRS